MSIPLHDFVIARLSTQRSAWPDVAKNSGVPLRTIEKIARFETRDPGIANVQKLADYFLAEDARTAAAVREKRGARA